MTIGELLDAIRGDYLAGFSELALAYRSKPGVEQVLFESAFRLKNGEVATEGPFSLPLRGDLIVIKEGKVFDSISYEHDRTLSFQPVEFQWATATSVEIRPFHWDACAIRVAAPIPESLAPLCDWFMRWFMGNPEANPPFQSAVHFMSDPSYESEELSLVVDLGSAPTVALEELFDCCVKLSATAVLIGA